MAKLSYLLAPFGHSKPKVKKSNIVQDIFDFRIVTPNKPVPSYEELDSIIGDFVNGLKLPEASKLTIINLTPQKKWQIFCTHQAGGDHEKLTVTKGPEYYSAILQAFARQQPPLTKDQSEFFFELRNVLRTASIQFLARFVESNTLEYLTWFMQKSGKLINESLSIDLLSCLKILVENKKWTHILSNRKNKVNTIIRFLDSPNLKIKVLTFKLMNIICISPRGHRNTLRAITQAHLQQGDLDESTRFRSLVNMLEHYVSQLEDRDRYCCAIKLLTFIMQFINTLIVCGEGRRKKFFRVHLRHEFLDLGIRCIINKLCKHDNKALNVHLECFLALQEADEKKMLMAPLDYKYLDMAYPQDMFNALYCKMRYAEASRNLISILLHLIKLPCDKQAINHWLTIDCFVQQIALQVTGGNGRDAITTSSKLSGHTVRRLSEEIWLSQKFMQINVNRNLKNQLSKDKAESFYKADVIMRLLDRIRCLEHENLELKVKSAAVAKTLDNEPIQEPLESAPHNTFNSVTVITKMYSPRGNRLNARALPSESITMAESSRISLPTKISKVASTTTTRLCDLFPYKEVRPKGIYESRTTASSSPPPPPPLPQAISSTKCVFSWHRLGVTDIEGTIWSKLAIGDGIKVIDLKDFDRFKQNKKESVIKTGLTTPPRGVNPSTRRKTCSIINCRRAQNCEILLRSLKISDDQIIEIITSMDNMNQLDADAIMQLMNVIPPRDECKALLSYNGNIENLITPDRFLYKLLKIQRYQERLKCLHFRKMFSTSLNDLNKHVDTISKALNELRTSRCFQDILQLLLVICNYLSKDDVCDEAYGFSISSLKAILEAKSNAYPKNTLMHWFVRFVKERRPELLKVKDEMMHVPKAGRILTRDIDDNVNALRLGLSEVSHELAFHRESESSSCELENKNFLQSMSAFVLHALPNFELLELQYDALKAEFLQTLRFFGEKNSNLKLEDFLGIINYFLISLEKCSQDIRFGNDLRRTMISKEVAKNQRQQWKLKLQQRRSKWNPSDDENDYGFK